MDTRRLNTRITFYSKTAGQNEDGEVVGSIKTEVYSCWAEVKGTTIKDFKAGGLDGHQDTKLFIIRYHPRPPFDNSMFIDFNGQEYRVIQIEIDYADKESIMIKAVRVS